MVDLRNTIIPKSDQLNADDLIGVTKTIKITGVKLCGEPDQPIALNFEGDNGKPYKPCKSMRRVLVKIWGPDGNAFVGRSMTLYRDEKVRFGGLEVGGIRISHMSDINAPVTMALTETKAKRKPYTVQPLGDGGAAGHRRTIGDALDELEAKLKECPTRKVVNEVLASDLATKIQSAARGESAHRLAAITKTALDRTASAEPTDPFEDPDFPATREETAE